MKAGLKIYKQGKQTVVASDGILLIDPTYTAIQIDLDVKHHTIENWHVYACTRKWRTKIALWLLGIKSLTTEHTVSEAQVIEV